VIRLFCMLMPLWLAGCSTTGDKHSDVTAEGDARTLFEKGKKQMKNGNYLLAIEKFETLVSRYPFGPYAQQAQLEIAYANYKSQEPDIAIAQADDFIKFNPEHPHVDYAYYIKALANFKRFESVFDKILPRDLAQLDPNPLKQSFLDFKLLVTRFPESRYAPDARQRMIFLRNILARRELEIADYYYRRGAWVAAVNRCEYLLENYDGADSTPDALVLMARAYQKLGLKDSYNDTLRLIEANFPHELKRLEKS
ncbi:MAG TPA: outer membrane protein assembly factor BamD, partial [Gammaproteobacteria bacterium]|nr:outer membrane protein assembly factor BamD [Gammaproteobacteria bacterium]